MLFYIRKNVSIEKLNLFYFESHRQFEEIAKLLKYSQTLQTLTIRSHGQSAQDIQLLANALVVNNSVIKFTFFDYKMNQDSAVDFLEQLKQGCKVEEVTLGVSGEAYVDYQFLGEVEECVQHINHIRRLNSISGFLTVEIVHWTSIYGLA